MAKTHPLISLDWLTSRGHTPAMANAFNFGWFKLRREIRAARNASERLATSVTIMEDEHTQKYLELREVERELEPYFEKSEQTSDPKAIELTGERNRLESWMGKQEHELNNQRHKRECRMNDLALLEGIKNGVYRIPDDYTKGYEPGTLVNSDAKLARHRAPTPVKKRGRITQDSPIEGDDAE